MILSPQLVIYLSLAALKHIDSIEEARGQEDFKDKRYFKKYILPENETKIRWKLGNNTHITETKRKGHSVMSYFLKKW